MARRGDKWEREERRSAAEREAREIIAAIGQQRLERERAADEHQRKKWEADRRRQEAERCEAEATVKTALLNSRMKELETILTSSLHRRANLPFASFKRVVHIAPFDSGDLGTAIPRPKWDEFAPQPPGPLGRLVGGAAKYQRDCGLAQENYERSCAEHAAQEEDRLACLAEKEREHADLLAHLEDEVRIHNACVDDFEAKFKAGQPNAVEQYFARVLSASVYPDGFPHRYRVAYRPDSRELVVEYQLPDKNIIPEERAFKAVKTRGEVQPVLRTAKSIKESYASVIAQVALRTLREIFDVEVWELVEIVYFNGHVSTTDQATGQSISPCLISVSATRKNFEDLVLAQVDPSACLRHLNALVSPHPYDLEPVRPVIDFDLSKYRFVEELDIAAGLDSRTDLLQMRPVEFEHLVRQLFEAMGMEAWVTQASRDDGVDAVAQSSAPVFGGVCVIQAKRYSRVVELDAVRALAGVMDDKRATKGILVTTSWFGKASKDFAYRHGRIDLYDGEHLKYLLQKHLGLDVLIALAKRPPFR